MVDGYVCPVCSALCLVDINIISSVWHTYLLTRKLVNLLTEAMGRTVMPGNCALMGATRLASGHFSAASMNVYVSKKQARATG